MAPTLERHPDSPPPSERFPSRSQDQKKSRILVVDDEPAILRSMSRILDRQGYSVATANDGDEALCAFRMERFDLVVSDYTMPGMNGFQLLVALKNLNPAVRVITQSGNLEKSEEARLISAGAFSVLHKPVDTQVLLAVVKTALEAPFEGRDPLSDNIIGAVKTQARVLYVDDDLALRETMGDAGECLGLDIQTSGDGKEALVYFIKNRPDVVVTDLHMPVMNGLELLKAIKSLDSNARVIVVSGEANPTEITSLYEAGAFRVIMKPFDLVTLSSAINESMGR